MSKKNIGFKTNQNIAQQMLFDELIENGQAGIEDRIIKIPYEEICKLSSIDQKILNLPEPYPFDIKLSQKGLFIKSDLILELGFYEYNHGQQIFGKRKGAIFSTDNGIDYLLSLDQFLLCEAVEEFNNLPNRDFPTNLIGFSEIKTLSRKSATILDSTLENEEIVVPQKISLKLSKGKDDSLEIHPDIENMDDFEKEEFEKKFKKVKKVRTNYTIKNSKGKKIRIPFTGTQKEEIQKIKKLSKVNGELKEKIIEHPENFFDSTIIDLNNFSARVIEIGLYKPRYFSFISPFKSEWIPGFIIDNGKSQKKVIIDSDAKLKNLKESINEAKAKSQSNVNFEDEDIPIAEAINIASIAERQLENPKEKIKISKNEKKVLIIEEHLDEVKYHEDKTQPSPTPEIFIHNFENPPNLREKINYYEYQKEGIAWLETLLNQDYSGGLLADDMGLGKTIQILSLIDWYNAKKNSNENPYLIVAPVSLLENWKNEFCNFFKSELDIELLYGSQKGKILISYLSQKKIFVTNYETIRNNQIVFGQIDWAIVILDEAQKIKTPGTLVTNAIKALKADFKIAATGTPVENSMVDLWSIVDFIVPGLLGSAKDFAKKYQTPINKNISDEELNKLGLQLRCEIGLYFKRRLKIDVLLNLPQKEVKSIAQLMPKIQENAYLQELENSNGDDKKNILTTIMNLKKISDHPYLIGYDWRFKSVDELIKSSAKMTILLKIIEDIKIRNEKVIIFAEYRITQKILQKVLKEIFNLSKISIINGETATQKGKRSQKETRQEAVDKFSEIVGFNVIIMSPLSAGVGLNVSASNNVVHYSRHWNPAKEAQATDRAYRIGQTKNVTVFYPMATLPEIKSFDEILNQLLKRKRNIADAAMFPSALTEVNSEDFSNEMNFDQTSNIEEHSLSVDDFNSFEPYFFESAIGSIFSEKGFDVVITPKSNDKGADVICFSEKSNLLIQVKKSVNSINDQAIGEILKAKGYYQKKFDKEFSLIVATNNVLNSNAKLIADENKVGIFEKDDIKEFLNLNKIYLSKIQKLEKKRYSRI